MTVKEFLATAYQDIPPGWRKGQAAFNRLQDARPALAESLRDSPNDPFHDDARLPGFENYIRIYWGLR